MSFHTFFELGMKRELPAIINTDVGTLAGPAVNLGCGNNRIPGTISLDLPHWDANRMAIPYDDESVEVIHAYHFLEHVNDPIAMLWEMQRVLMPAGLINVCVPYYTSQMAHHDLTHKSFWTEETWRNTFNNTYYSVAGKEPQEWKLRVGFNLICGIKERNLCLLTQLYKAK